MIFFFTQIPPPGLLAPFLISSFMFAIIPSLNLPPAILPGHKKVSSLTLYSPLPSTLESRSSEVSEDDSNYQKVH